MTTLHDTPQDLVDRYVAAFNAGESVAPLYEDGGVVVAVPGHPGDPASSAARLREYGTMTATVRRSYVVGDLGLLVVDWAVGDFSGTATDVVRFVGGVWRYVIDNPHGVG